MFDHLMLPSYAAIRSFVTKWLQESLLRGDLPRLLQPLLSLVLAPNTKRIGVVHAHMLRQSEKESTGSAGGGVSVADIWYNPDSARLGRSSMPDLDADDLNIIAVSTENGNVAYQRLSTTAANNQSNSTSSSGGPKGPSGGVQRRHELPQLQTSRPSVIAGEGGVVNGGGVGVNLMAKQKKSPIRTIQKRIFGVSLMSGHGGLAGSYGGGGAIGKGVLRDGNNNSMTNVASNSISVIINPMEATTAAAASGSGKKHEQLRSASASPVDSVRIKLHAGDTEEDEEDEPEQKVLSSSAPTGAVSFLIAASDATGTEEDKKRQSTVDPDDHCGYEDDDEMEADEEEVSVDDVAADLSLADQPTNNSDEEDADHDADEDESSFQHHHLQTTTTNGDQQQDGRSSCDSEGNSNRFVGDVNFITDVMSEHDRTKNKKNYSLEGMKAKAAQVVQRQKAAREAKKAEKKGKKKQQRLSGASKASSDSGSGKSNFSGGGGGHSVPIGKDGDSAEGMDELLLRNNINWEKSKRNVEILRENNKRKFKFFDKIHPLHSHMLLYYGVYDTKRVLHCLRTLRIVLANEPRTFICLSMTTSVAEANVKGLLVR